MPSDDPMLTPEEEAELVDQINGNWYLQPNPPAAQADDAGLVEELAKAIRLENYGSDEGWQNCIPEARAILPILHRERAAAHAAGRAEAIADAIAAQPFTDQDVIGAYERGHLRGVMDYAKALRAIERGQHGRTSNPSGLLPIGKPV